MLLLDIESTKKNTLAVYTTTDTFTMIDMTLHIQFLHWMLDNPQIRSYCGTYTFSPTTVSLQHLFSTEHFFSTQQIFSLHFFKKKYWNDSENGFRIIGWLNEDKYQFWFIISYKQGQCKSNYSLTFSNYFEHYNPSLKPLHRFC